jgi:hypothetical protein
MMFCSVMLFTPPLTPWIVTAADPAAAVSSEPDAEPQG